MKDFGRLDCWQDKRTKAFQAGVAQQIHKCGTAIRMAFLDIKNKRNQRSGCHDRRDL